MASPSQSKYGFNTDQGYLSDKTRKKSSFSSLVTR